ncbi:hypothetical protein BIU90_03705 [Curtobacterium sp. MCBA15_001]|nr:hypothetical protein BIU90_03705 [Curtobacterium sp. MCBA15_001]
MLVTMKRTVLTRAAEPRPQPRRRGRRAGIVIGVIAVLGLGATSGGVALGMIPQPFAAAPAPAPSAAPAQPSGTPTPSSAPVVNEPTSTPTPSATASAGRIPTDCRSVVPASEYDRLFGDLPLQDPAGSPWGTDTDDPVPGMFCVWLDPQGDGSNISIGFGTTDPEWVPTTDDGWACVPQDGGHRCASAVPEGTGPRDTTSTFFIKGGTYIGITQTNAPTNGLLKAIEQQVWG